MSGIHVRIDRLVVDGTSLAPGDAGLLREAIQTELRRLLTPGSLAGDSVPASGAHVHALRTPVIGLVSASNPTLIGTQLARAVHGELRSVTSRGLTDKPR